MSKPHCKFLRLILHRHSQRVILLLLLYLSVHTTQYITVRSWTCLMKPSWFSSNINAHGLWILFCYPWIWHRLNPQNRQNYRMTHLSSKFPACSPFIDLALLHNTLKQVIPFWYFLLQMHQNRLLEF